MEPSKTYYRALELTKQHHSVQQKTFSGQFTWKMKDRIKSIIDVFEVKTILDYGAGRGKQYENIDPDTGKSLEDYWGIVTTKYDPGVKHYAAEPKGKFDLVICVQVLGSIPKGDLSWVVDRLYGFSDKAIFVSERLKRPRKQIYASIEDEMPHGMTRDEWAEILKRPSPPKMIFASKTDRWVIEEIN